MSVSHEEISLLREQGLAKAGLLRTAWLTVMFYLFWLILGTTFLLGCAYCALINPLLPRARARAHGRRAIRLAFAFVLGAAERMGILKLDLDALSELEQESGLILAPNHPSLLDVALVGCRLSDMSCIMKAELWDNIFLGAGARLARYIRNDSINSMIRLAADDVAQGSKLLMFPEGTRTVRNPVNRFKGGMALISKRAHVPVQTLFVETDTSYLGKGWPFYRKPVLPISYRVTLGRRFPAPESVERTMNELQAYFESELVRHDSGTVGRIVRKSPQTN